MTTVRPVHWCQRANGPLMAQKANNYIAGIKAQTRSMPLTWAGIAERATGIEPA